MKKLLTILLALLCCVATVLADEPDTKTTDVSYTVEESYEWTVPSDTEFTALATDQKLEDEVSVIKCLIADKNVLKISLDDTDGANDMLLEYAGDKVAYEVALTEGGDALAAGDLVLKVASGELAPTGEGSTKTQNVYGKITGSPKKAGTYEDTLTFVANVIALKTVTYEDQIGGVPYFVATFDCEPGMTWGEWINSEYYESFKITNTWSDYAHQAAGRDIKIIEHNGYVRDILNTNNFAKITDVISEDSYVSND